MSLWLLQGNVLESPYKEFERVFKDVWGNNADAISTYYSGTGALKVGREAPSFAHPPTHARAASQTGRHGDDPCEGGREVEDLREREGLTD